MWIVCEKVNEVKANQIIYLSNTLGKKIFIKSNKLPKKNSICFDFEIEAIHFKVF